MPCYISTRICGAWFHIKHYLRALRSHHHMSTVTNKMKCWPSSNMWSLMMVAILMFRPSEGGCIEVERRALHDIKSSLINLYDSKREDLLPTWIDYGSGSECCDWERVKCNKATGHVTELSLFHLNGFSNDDGRHMDKKVWPLNVSLFLHFEELTSLDLSRNHLDGGIMKTELERLWSLKMLEILDLSWNSDIDNNILPSLIGFTSLKSLDLSRTRMKGYFPAKELSHLTNLEELYFSDSRINGTPNIQACKSLSRLKRLESIHLSENTLNKSIISCLSVLPSLKILNLSHSTSWGGPFPVQEIHNLSEMEVLFFSGNGFSGTLPMEAFTSFNHLEVLDLSRNNFVGGIPSTIHALSSLRVVSFAYNQLNGLLPDHGFCELNNLHELDLSHNMLDGILPRCFNNLSSLKLFDISSNRFTGVLVPSLIANLTSLEYIDFSHNTFEGSFSFSSFSNHTKLEVVGFRSDNDKFEVETEEPIGWIPLFQLEVLEISNCNVNSRKGRVVPGFLIHQHKLRVVDMSENSLNGQFPDWLIKNNTNLNVLNLRNNSFGSMLLYRNVNMQGLDISGNHMIGTIPDDIQKFFPYLYYLNLSRNALSGTIPSSVGDLGILGVLDLSDNDFSGEVPKGLFTNLSQLSILKLSNNRLHGHVLSGNLILGNMERVHLDNNHFIGKIGIKSKKMLELLNVLDISNNFFEGTIPVWISNMSSLSQLVVRNNSLEGRFPCGIAPLSFLDISHNAFFGPIPSHLNLKYMKHLHLGSNRFTGSIPNYFRNLTNILTLDIGDNKFSGRIPKFLGELSNLRILLLRNNNFSGSIPKQLCQLSNVSLIDLSSNSLSGTIPSCLQNITGPSDIAFVQQSVRVYPSHILYNYRSALDKMFYTEDHNNMFEIQDEVQFTTKSLSLPYKGGILDIMSGLDLSCNKLTGEIPKELGLLSQILTMNLSHNQLTGSIPTNFSSLAKIESLDLSSNGLTGTVPSELIKLTSLSVFNVSNNNLSGRLPEMKAQFGTFTEASYEGNPLLCGPPLEKKCVTESQVTNPLLDQDNEKWYDFDMTCFYGSSSSTCVVFLLGFVALLYTNPEWRRRWLDWVEYSMFTCYYILYDSVSKCSIPFHR